MTPSDYTHSDDARRVIRKLRTAGWSLEAIMRMFYISENRLHRILNGEDIRWKPKVNLETILAYEYLPELRTAELHYISQLRTFGYTLENIATATNTPMCIASGRDGREWPNYHALTTLIALADGKAEPISPTPNCVVEHCQASGEWVHIAEGTFCPVHAERARRVLGITRQETIAA